MGRLIELVDKEMLRFIRPILDARSTHGNKKRTDDGGARCSPWAHAQGYPLSRLAVRRGSLDGWARCSPWAHAQGYLLSRLRRCVRDRQAANAAEATHAISTVIERPIALPPRSRLAVRNGPSPRFALIDPCAANTTRLVFRFRHFNELNH